MANLHGPSAEMLATVLVAYLIVSLMVLGAGGRNGEGHHGWGVIDWIRVTKLTEELKKGSKYGTAKLGYIKRQAQMHWGKISSR